MPDQSPHTPPHRPQPPPPSQATASTKATRATKRPRSAGRKALIAGGALVGVVALGELTGWPFLREPLEQQIHNRTGVDIQLDGRFRTRLLVSPMMSVEQITLGAGGGVDVPHLLKANNLVVQWRWGDLWRARQGAALRVKSLQADRIDAHAVRLKSGAASWDIVPRNTDAPPQTEPAPLPEIERLVLREGQVAFRDETLDIELNATIEHSREAGGTMPWQATAEGSYRGAPIKLQAKASADLPLLLQTDADAPLLPLQLSGRIGSTQLAFDGAAGALWAGQGVEGQLKISGDSLQASARPLGVTLPDTPPYQLNARVVRQGATWSVVSDEATVGSSSLTANLKFQTDAHPPRLTGELGGARLALADLAPAVGADKPPRRSDRVLPDERFDVPSLGQMDADVQVKLRQLDFGTPALAPVQDLKLHLQLANSRLVLSALSARVAGGTLSGDTAFEVKGDLPQWDAALRFSEVDLDSWIRGLSKGDAKDAKGGQPDARSYMSGTLDATAQLKGQGRSVAEILGSANGQFKLRVTHGQLSQLVTEAAGLDAAQALGMLIKGDEPLKLNCALVDAVVQNGVVKSRHAVLDNDDSTLRLQGGLSFKSEAIQLRLVSEPKDFSPLSLRSPVTVSGQLKTPQVGIEAGGLLARAAGALALGSLAPPAALLAFIDVGNNDDPAPCAPAPAAASEKATSPAPQKNS
ncbi:AsmA family protein [Hydrogenophaga sp. PAMC20947]|uniref:AsmA family protein n=1 Tax=Hydrogenophaga sp. PAMC20947 TaxID=2565558 RepID=UPI0014458E8A|nr:AsmA family protein [Hydrogenophaga sp. PAMC20947]